MQQPVYVKKSNPEDRVTWMDKFISQEPKGGFRDVIELAWHGRAKVVVTATMAINSDSSRIAA